MTTLPLVVSATLPIYPDLETDVVRTVRHRLSRVLHWLGESAGPKPGEATHVIAAGDGLLVSQEVFDRLRHTAIERRDV